MTAAFDFACTRGVLDVSPTVATLDVRVELAVLRSLATSGFEHAELDRLEQVLVDAFVRMDGYVDPGNHGVLEEKVKDLETELREEEGRREKEEGRREKAEAALETYLETDEDTVEQVLAGLLKEQGEHDAEIEAMKARIKLADEVSDKLRRDAQNDRRQLEEMRVRMGVWLEDKTAAETADMYREKCETVRREREDIVRTVRETLEYLENGSPRSEVRRYVIHDIRNTLASKGVR